MSALLSSYIWLTKTFMQRFTFNSIMPFLISPAMHQLKNWANIGFGPHWFLFKWSLCLVQCFNMAGSADLKVNFFKRIWEIQLTCNEAIQEPGGIFPYDSFWILWNVFKDYISVHLLCTILVVFQFNECCLHLGLQFCYLPLVVPPWLLLSVLLFLPATFDLAANPFF